MRPRFTIKFPEDTLRDVVCISCGNQTRYDRDELTRLLKTTLFHDHCPSCGAPYYDWTPEPSSLSVEEKFTKFGRTVAEVLKHRGDADDVALDSNIGFVLLAKEEKRGLKAFTKAERIVYAVQGMVREVNNGGFHQFFYNSSGALAYDLAPALNAIGSKQALSIAVRALEVFGRPRSLTEAARQRHLNKLTRGGETDPWEALDSEYYDGMTEPLESMLLDYAAGRTHEFDS